MDLTAIRRALAKAAMRVQVRPNLTGYAFPVSNPAGPCFEVVKIEVAYDQTMSGDTDLSVQCRVLAGPIEEQVRHEYIDALLDSSGSRSLKEAIESLRPVNGGRLVTDGLADDLIVRRFVGHAEYQVGGQYLVGGDIDIDVYGVRR